MRTIILCLALLMCSSAQADDIFVFTATWCGPCNQLKKALSDNPDTFRGHTVSMFDLDANKDLAKLYGINSVPTILHFTAEKKIRRYTGFHGIEHLKNWLNNTGVRRFLRHRF